MSAPNIDRGAPLEASNRSRGLRIIADLDVSERPRNRSGLPWDVRPIVDPDAVGRQLLGCAIAQTMLLRLDFALRIAVLAILPTAVITYDTASAKTFVAPSLAVICSIVVPSLRVGLSLSTVAAILTAIAIHQPIGHIVVAMDPAGVHWALWFAIYIVVELAVAFFAEGAIVKFALYFFNITMVRNWNRQYPEGISPHQFTGLIAVSVLVGSAFGAVVAFLPYPRTCRDDAEARLKAFFENLSTTFAGTVQSVWIFGSHPSVQRRIAVNRVDALRRSLDRQFDALSAAVTGMRTEIHTAAVLDRLGSRLRNAIDLLAALDGLIDMIHSVARAPEQVDEGRLVHEWGLYMFPVFVLASEYAEEYCDKAGDINYEFSNGDVRRINRLRERVRMEVQEVRRRTLLSEEVQVDPHNAFPFISIGYLLYNFGRFLRLLGAFPVEAADDGSGEPAVLFDDATHPEAFDDLIARDASVASAQEERPLQSPATHVRAQEQPPGASATHHEPFATVPPNNEATPEAPKLRSRRFTVSVPTTGPDVTSSAVSPQVSLAGLPAPSNFGGDSFDGATVRPAAVLNTSFYFVLPPPQVAPLPHIEPVVVRLLLAWPRGLLSCWHLAKLLASGDLGAMVKLREAAKLTFAATSALALLALLDKPFPTNGCALLSFVKDQNAGLTIITSFDYIASTILGSVYGFLAASVATDQSLIIVSLCVIGFLAGLPRLSPKYAYFATLTAFFAVLGVAPGSANSSLLLSTIQTNVALSTWLVVSHSALWPVWPSDVLAADLQNAMEQLRSMMANAVTAMDVDDDHEAGEMADHARDARSALKATTEALRRHLTLCVQEPTTRPTPFPDREFHRVVDAIERTVSLIYPFACAVGFLRRDLPPMNANHVPTSVLQALRSHSSRVTLLIDQLLRGLQAVVMSPNPSEVVASLLETQNDLQATLREAQRCGYTTYKQNLAQSLNARAYEMPAIHTILHFFEVIPDHLNTLLEALIEARRQQQFTPLVAV